MSKESPLGGARSPLARLQSERLGRLVVSGLLVIPLLADLVAAVLGFQVFYLADPKLQAVWGTLAQVLAGWPLYGEAVGHVRRGGARRAFVLCLLSTLAYLASLYSAFAYPGLRGLFLGSAGLILAAYLVDYREAKRQR